MFSLRLDSKLERGYQRRQYDRYSSFGSCFNCGKPGHRAFECRNTQGAYSRFSNNLRPGACFICGQPGHKAPECPNRGNTKEEAPSVFKNSTGENKGEKKINVVDIGTHPNIVEAMINGNLVRLVVDSGAQISVVPEAIVKEDQITNDFVLLEGIAKKKIPAKLALIPFKIGSLEFVRESAILPGGLEHDCALLSHDFRSSVDRSLVDSLFGDNPPDKQNNEMDHTQVTVPVACTEVRLLVILMTVAERNLGL